MSLLSMSLAGTLIILVTAFIRALAIERLPKGAFLALWGVALVRLLVPYTLPFALNVYSLAGRLGPTKAAPINAPAAPMPHAIPASHVVLTAPASPTPAVPAVDPRTAVWLAGAAICGLAFLLAYGWCRREFKTSLPVDDARALELLAGQGLRRRVSLRRSDKISAPLTYGVLRPVILLPKSTDWSDREALEYVLAHECIHIRRFDAVTKLVLTAAVCVHWFNPAVWAMYVLANRDLELSCDEAVVRRFGATSRTGYAMALIRMEETRSGLRPLCNHFSKNAIEERIVAIMKIKKTSLAALIAAVVLVAGVTVAFATSGQTPDSQAALAATQSPEAEASAQAENDWTWPVDGDFPISYGNDAESGHGVDIAATEGTPVKAALAGTVSETGLDPRWGNYVLLTHGDGDTSFYSCLKSISVDQGAQVAQNDVIGTVGNSGMSTGPHLHFKITRGTTPAVDDQGTVTDQKTVTYGYQSYGDSYRTLHCDPHVSHHRDTHFSHH